MRTRSIRDASPIPAPHRTVARPRLLRRLDAAARCKLTLVAGPQGCGKSTLLAQWASTRRDLGALLSFEHVAGASELAALLVTPLERLTPALVDLQLFAQGSFHSALGLTLTNGHGNFLIVADPDASPSRVTVTIMWPLPSLMEKLSLAN